MTRTEKAQIAFWMLGVPIVAWSLHFLAAYVVAAVYCARNASLDTAVTTPLSAVRWWIAAATVLTLAITLVTAGRGYSALGRRAAWRGNQDGNNDIRDQDRFLASVLLLLCALSAVATLFVTAVAFAFGDCRQ